jgi:hypothetical protein
MAIVPRQEPARKAEQESKPDGEWAGTEESILDEVDRILDKISAEGMGSLTNQERDTLDQVSRRHRSN